MLCHVDTLHEPVCLVLCCRYLQETEPFDRGFYAGPFGWVTGQGAEFAVAIRSAMIPAENGIAAGVSDDQSPAVYQQQQQQQLDHRVSLCMPLEFDWRLEVPPVWCVVSYELRGSAALVLWQWRVCGVRSTR